LRNNKRYAGCVVCVFFGRLFCPQLPSHSRQLSSCDSEADLFVVITYCWRQAPQGVIDACTIGNVPYYNLWMLDNLPVILILFDSQRKRAYWLAVQQYFREDENRQPKQGAKTIRVRVPMRERVNRWAVVKFRELNRQAFV
jgi:hypothetical protein